MGKTPPTRDRNTDRVTPRFSKPGFQLRPAARQPALNGSKRATQLCGRLFLGQAVEVAEDQRIAEGLRKRTELVVEGRPIFVILDSFQVGVDDMARGSHFSPSELVCERRAAAARALAGDPKSATPCSQHATDSRRPIDRARRASTRNVAWAASSASSSPARICRQTRKTIAPCRSTSAAKAASAIFAAALEETLEQLPVGQAAGGARAEERFDLLDEFHRACDRMVTR